MTFIAGNPATGAKAGKRDRMEGRLSNGVAARQLPVGRALLTRRGEPADTVQIALS